MRLFGLRWFLAATLLLQIPNLWAKDHLIIMAGQSNMMGRGKTAQLPAAYHTTPTNISFFYQGRPHRLAEFGYFGPEVTFAHAVAHAFPHDHIILVKQAATGSSIRQWQPNSSLYRGLLRQIGFATEQHPIVADAIIWMQGESDARSQSDIASQYGAQLGQLVRSLRRDIGAPRSLLLVGEINPEHPAFHMTERVRQQQALAQQQLSNTLLITTQGLGKMADGIHYNAAGQMELGLRFAHAYIRHYRQ